MPGGWLANAAEVTQLNEFKCNSMSPEYIVRLAKEKRIQEALSICDYFITENPGCHDGYVNRAYLFAHDKRYNDVIKTINQIETFDKLQPYELFLRGESYLCLRVYNAAIADFTKILEFEEGGRQKWSTTAYLYRSIAYNEKGEYESALKDCEHLDNEARTYIFGRIIFKKDIVSNALAHRGG